jgi:hypothetical protein
MLVVVEQVQNPLVRVALVAQVVVVKVEIDQDQEQQDKQEHQEQQTLEAVVVVQVEDQLILQQEQVDQEWSLQKN